MFDLTRWILDLRDDRLSVIHAKVVGLALLCYDTRIVMLIGLLQALKTKAQNRFMWFCLTEEAINYSSNVYLGITMEQLLIPIKSVVEARNVLLSTFEESFTLFATVANV